MMWSHVERASQNHPSEALRVNRTVTPVHSLSEWPDLTSAFPKSGIDFLTYAASNRGFHNAPLAESECVHSRE